MRADRLLRLVVLLQRHGTVSAGWLAERLEVSERTVLRDMEALSAAGVPAYTTPGRHGGCSLVDGFRTDATGLTTSEARALFAWLGRSGASELGLSAELTGALAKVAASVPETSMAEAEATRAVLSSDRRRWFGEADEVPHLPGLRSAAEQGRRVRIRYAAASTGGEPSRLTIDPWGLVDHSGRWYLVAAHRGEARMYRVSRVLSVTELDDPVRLPDDRSLEEVWAGLRSRFEAEGETVEVLLRVDPARAKEVRGPLRTLVASGDIVEADGAATDSPRGAGWPAWRLTVRHARRIVGFALTWSDCVELVAPESLLEDLRGRLVDAEERYRR